MRDGYTPWPFPSLLSSLGELPVAEDSGDWVWILTLCDLGKGIPSFGIL